ncbi:MAG: DUF2442 domain-containing protein [Marinilabiliaceae bacterium]|nr:DUF2442 domain-containing protein [Marinilabiliaceae bacterium]
MSNYNKIIKLINANYIKDYVVELLFDDGIVQQINFANFLYRNPHPQYDKYRDLKYFKQFKIERNNIVWGKNWDLIFDLWDLYKGRQPK